MFGFLTRRGTRHWQVREQRARTALPGRARLLHRILCWPSAAGLTFIIAASAVSLIGEASIDYAIGQRLQQPIYARVAFQVPDPKKTAADREAARAKTPSYYTLNDPALTFNRIRADLMRMYQVAVDADTFEAFATGMEQIKLPLQAESAAAAAYQRLRALADLPDDAGRERFKEWVNKLPLETQFVVKNLSRENRKPPATTDYILLETRPADGEATVMQAANSELVPQGSDKAVEGSASLVARKIPAPELRQTVQDIVHAAFREQPTIIFNQERTVAAMQKAEEATPEAMTTYERDKPFVAPGILGTEAYSLIQAHEGAYSRFLQESTPQAQELQQERVLQRLGLIALAAILSFGIVAYARIYQRTVFETPGRTIALFSLLLATMAACRLLDMNWPHLAELQYIPCMIAAYVLAIAYPRRFAMGVMCAVALLAAAVARVHLTFLVTLLAGVVAAVYQLDEIRTRVKLPVVGTVTALCVAVVSAASGLFEGQPPDFMLRHALWAGGCAWLSAFLVAGLLPFLERVFRIATSLTLLEWRDPTRPLLQLLAREAPGTYNHSLLCGTLVEAACGRIGANGLLTQVGALYHDIGKIHRASYFSENQEGRISRHENLAPTMSLLIILGHVKDGLEMARQYRLPPILHQFIGEHHGTTVVRYFHHRATENQPRIASGRNDRDVAESTFRYGGPRPRTRESAVLMLSDGVEGAVRSLHEPTVGRIEGTVHQIVMDRLNDGQFDDCDITLREIRQVEDSLVKTLCGIYHGRVAYPKARKGRAEAVPAARASV